MILKRFFEPLIAQASYLIGCGACGEAIVIDPNRDVQQYTDAAQREGVTITHVTETHIHADFVSGARELANRTGATLCLSDEGDESWKYRQAEHQAYRWLKHGDRIDIGNVKVDIVHTPGHTPEHLTFLITDGAVADQPIAAVTGDFIFVGDVGRPDLLERAANMAGTMEAGARTLWKSLQAFARHPDWLQIWPGHGAGSSCGKGISAIPHSTLGYERLFNWAFAATSEDQFVAGVLSGQPDPPPYFAVMKAVNKNPPLLRDLPQPVRLADAKAIELVREGAFVIDNRPATEYAKGHVKGTLNIPLNGSFVTWAGWLIPYDRPLYVMGDTSAGRLEETRRELALIGLHVHGYFGESAIEAAAQGAERQTIAQVRPDQIPSGQAAAIIDVRSEAEWNEGHIPSAIHIPLGHLAARIDEVPRDRQVILQCQSGGRSAIAASLLQKMGRAHVANLAGGLDAWSAMAIVK